MTVTPKSSLQGGYKPLRAGEEEKRFRDVVPFRSKHMLLPDCVVLFLDGFDVSGSRRQLK